MPPGERHARGAGTGEGAAVPAVATRGRCADSPSTLIFTLGPMVNWGRVGTGFSPECDAAGWGAGGERGGESQGQDPLPLLQLGSESPSPVPSTSTPRKPGEPQSRGAKDGVAAGSRLYSLEAQQTNTFILRHFQCRLWVGVAGEETGPESFSPEVLPRALLAQKRASLPPNGPSCAVSFRTSSTLWALVVVALPLALEAPGVLSLNKQ